jgi:hypothetical protein
VIAILLLFTGSYIFSINNNINIDSVAKKLMKLNSTATIKIVELGEDIN